MSRIFARRSGSSVYLYDDTGPNGGAGKCLAAMKPDEARDLLPELEQASVEALESELTEVRDRIERIVREVEQLEQPLPLLQARAAELKRRLA